MTEKVKYSPAKGSIGDEIKMRPNGKHIRSMVEKAYDLKVDKVTVREWEDKYTCIIVIKTRLNQGEAKRQQDVKNFWDNHKKVQGLLESEYGKVFALVNMQH